MENKVTNAEHIAEADSPPRVDERTDSNANINVTFTENNIEAWGDFYPASGKGLPFSPDYFNSLLKANNIVFGIQKDTVQDAIYLCNMQKKIVKNVLIAKGTPPVDGIADYMQKNPALDQPQAASAKVQVPEPLSPNKVPDRNPKIDYKAVSHFVIVRKGQALAKIKNPKPGNDGRNVNGKVIPFKIIHPKSVQGGENTRMEGRFLVAETNGQLVDTGGILNVKESLNIKGPVDYHTGNIAFPGDVVIEGPVSDGFKLYSGGSISIKQTLDVTDAVSKGDLVVAGGIIGRGHAMLKVGGNIRTKFIENCQIACRKTVFVTSEIINSRIFTLENVEMGDKSLILAGEIFAVNGISAGGIGKKSTPAARIHCGVDFTVNQEKEKYNYRLRVIAAKLERIRQLLEEPLFTEEKKARLDEARTRLEEEQKTAMTKVSELLGRLNINDKACVEVSGEIAVGTLIEICQIALFVNEPLRRVKIRLDREKNKLAVDKL